MAILLRRTKEIDEGYKFDEGNSLRSLAPTQGLHSCGQYVWIHGVPIFVVEFPVGEIRTKSQRQIKIVLQGVRNFQPNPLLPRNRSDPHVGPVFQVDKVNEKVGQHPLPGQ